MAVGEVDALEFSSLPVACAGPMRASGSNAAINVLLFNYKLNCAAHTVAKCIRHGMLVSFFYI